MNHFAWALIVTGLFIVAVGVFFLLGPSISWLGKLPGDFRIEGEHTQFYFPLATCVLISVLLSALLWLIQYLRQ